MNLSPSLRRSFVINFCSFFSQLQFQLICSQVKIALLVYLNSKKKNEKRWKLNIWKNMARVGRIKLGEFRSPSGQTAEYYHILMYNTYHLVWLSKAELLYVLHVLLILAL